MVNDRHVERRPGPLDRVVLDRFFAQSDLADLHSLDVAVLGQPNREPGEVSLPVGCEGGHGDHRRRQHQIGLSERPDIGVGERKWRRHVVGVAWRRAGVDPAGDDVDLLVTQRGVILELLNPDVPFDEPGGHLADRCPLFDGPRPRPHFVVAD